MKKIVTISILLLSIQAISFSQYNHNGWNNTPLKDFTFYNQYFTRYSQWSHNPWEHNKYPWNHHNKEWTNIFLPWGNVGIGTLMPEAKLHVVGSSLFNGKITADTLEIGTDLRIGNNLSILGNLGIGVESPIERLEVNGNIKSTGTVQADSLNTRSLFSESGLFSNDLALGNNLLVTGNIGIGVDSPTQRLEVGGNIKAANIFVEDELTANSLGSTTLTTKDIFATGNVGIGTDQPGAPLHVNGTIRSKNIICDDEITTVNLSGTHAALSTLTINSKLGIGVEDPSEAIEVTGNAIFSGNIKSSMIEAGGIVSSGGLNLQESLIVGGDANISGNITADKLTVNTIDIPSGQLSMEAFSAQSVNVETGLTIGSEDLPDDYMLAVKGNVIAEKIKVRLFDDWPDYVFADNYKLKSINHLEEFINTNKHLPGMPSAQEMEQKDVDLGEMQMKLLEKVEELSLYIIELHKENEALKARIDRIEAAAK